MDVSLLDEVLTEMDHAARHEQNKSTPQWSRTGRGRGKGKGRGTWITVQDIHLNSTSFFLFAQNQWFQVQRVKQRYIRYNIDDETETESSAGPICHKRGKGRERGRGTRAANENVTHNPNPPPESDQDTEPPKQQPLPPPLPLVIGQTVSSQNLANCNRRYHSLLITDLDVNCND